MSLFFCQRRIGFFELEKGFFYLFLSDFKKNKKKFSNFQAKKLDFIQHSLKSVT
jgi:hypothetical protein